MRLMRNPRLLLPFLPVLFALALTGCEEEETAIVEPGTCWVYSSNSDRLTLVDDNGDLDIVVNDPGAAAALAADTNDGTVWLVDTANRRLLKYSPEGVLLRLISGFAGPLDVAVNPDTRDVYLLDAGAGSLTAFDKDGEELWSLDASYQPVEVVISGAAGARRLIIIGPDELRCVDAELGQQLWSLDIERDLEYRIDAAVEAESFWLCDGDTLDRRSLNDGSVEYNHDDAAQPRRVGVNNLGCWFYDAADGDLYLIDDTGAELAEIEDLPGVPELGGTGDKLWLIVESDDLVALYDENGDEVVRTTAVVGPAVLGPVR